MLMAMVPKTTTRRRDAGVRPVVATEATCGRGVEEGRARDEDTTADGESGLLLEKGTRASGVKGVAEQQRQGEEEHGALLKKALVVCMGAVLLMGASVDEAMAARSGGRVGGSRGFSSSRRSAPPPRAAPGGSVRSYNYYSAPPLVSPYGFGMPFFGGGLVAPFPLFGLGSLFNIILLMFMVNIVVNVIGSFTNGGTKRGSKDDRWDDDDDERW